MSSEQQGPAAAAAAAAAAAGAPAPAPPPQQQQPYMLHFDHQLSFHHLPRYPCEPQQFQPMDPKNFIPYGPLPSTLSGLPQESKLATYMGHNANAAQQSTSLQHSYGKAIAPPSHVMGHSYAKVQLDAAQHTLSHGYPTLNMDLQQSFSNMKLESPPKKMYYYIPPQPVMQDTASVAPQPMLREQSPQVHQENVGGTTYFYSTTPESANTAPPPPGGVLVSDGHLVPAGLVSNISPYTSAMYTAPPTLIHAMPHTAATAGLNDYNTVPKIRSEMYDILSDISSAANQQAYNDMFHSLPTNVDIYAELLPLERNIMPTSTTTSFRAMNRQNSEFVALRRIHNYDYEYIPPLNASRLELWKQVVHPNVVALLDCFVAKSFGDNSLIMVYHYHPKTETLLSKYQTHSGSSDTTTSFHDPFSSDPDAPRPYTHQKNTMLRAVASGALLPESVIWSTLLQIIAGLRAIHGCGLACRKLDPSKVIVFGYRVRIAWAGVDDAMQVTVNDTAQAQQDDVTALGRIAMFLACRNVSAETPPGAIDLIARTYSTDLKNLIIYLTTPSATPRTMHDIMPMIGARFFTQVEVMQQRSDTLESQLWKEMDAGRLFRIIVKMAAINERPEFNLDGSWSETGDRYMLKLYRDYLFHAVNEDGRPFLDVGHITYSLNQLDAGCHTMVELTSRDDQSVLVISYAELKHCLEQAFDELMPPTNTSESAT